MPLRRLGRTDLNIAPLVLGGNVFGWTADKKASFAVLDRFAAAGMTAIDTADVYSAWAPGNHGGELEAIIGEWMKARGNRSRIIVVTKVGSPMGKGKEGLSAALHRRGGRSLAEAPRDRRDRPLSLALARHGDADRGDARRLSAPDREGQDPLVRRLEPQCFAARGGARGGEGARGSRATRCCSRNTISPTATNSRTASPPSASARRSASSPISASRRASCRASTAPRPTSTKSPRGGGVKAYLNPRGFRILDALEAVAARHKAKPAEIALAWVMARPGVTAPIASATSVEQVDSLVRATELTLSASDMAALNEASAP